MRTKIPFVGPSSPLRSINAGAERSLNCYVEMNNASPRAPIALYGTPGTVRKATLPKLGIRNCITEGGYTWWVASDTVYRMNTAYVVTTLGAIGTTTGEIGLVSNGSQLLIVDGVAGWIVDVAAATLTQIIDPDFPNGVTRAAYQDGFFLVTGDGSGRFYMCELPNSGSAWNGLDFASAEGSPDNTVGIISDHREVWLFGSDSAEVYVNTGAEFPFQRSGNAFIEHGCAAAGTIAKADNTVFWLGTDSRGSGIVWRADGYTPIRVSTHGLESEFATYSTISDATAFTYQQEGHIFYVLHFPTASKTWVFDAATQAWGERAYRHPSTGVISRWRPNCMCFINGEHLVGDYETGAIYKLDLNTYTDDGAPILRLRATSALESAQTRLFFSSLQIDMETGVGLTTGQGSAPLLMLRYSNDGGHTWSNEKTSNIGAVGQYGQRAKYTRLGNGRNRVWEISMTDPVKFAVFGAVLESEQGTE